MSTPLPNFMIIGAMKSGTSTLHEQLALQEGVFMSTPKEPNFFSDDDQWSKGLDWYTSLFADAGSAQFIGESSTHYTKLPTYPDTVNRMTSTLGTDLKLIYIQRDPVDRLISHYIHQWTMGVMTEPIDEAIEKYPELVAYSQYEMQLAPFKKAFGDDAILELRFEDMKADPDAFFEAVRVFLGGPESWTWNHDLAPQNVSSQRMRETPMLRYIRQSPTLTFLRRTLLTEKMREFLKKPYRMENRPNLEHAREKLEGLF